MTKNSSQSNSVSNTEKKTRGRHRKTIIAPVANASRRTELNWNAALIAKHTLTALGIVHKLPLVVLTELGRFELGRFERVESIISLGKHVIASKMTTREAVRYVRLQRLGRRESQVELLLAKVRKLRAEWQERYGLSPEESLEDLKAVMRFLEA